MKFFFLSFFFNIHQNSSSSVNTCHRACIHLSTYRMSDKTENEERKNDNNFETHFTELIVSLSLPFHLPQKHNNYKSPFYFSLSLYLYFIINNQSSPFYFVRILSMELASQLLLQTQLRRLQIKLHLLTCFSYYYYMYIVKPLKQTNCNVQPIASHPSYKTELSREVEVETRQVVSTFAINSCQKLAYIIYFTFRKYSTQL